MYGTPSCARCSKSVYAAEQVLGPGRKAYHRPCLSCTQCSKRLDSLSLLEHDEMPYCKPCHSRNFGTADLRSQNLPTAGRPMSPVKQIDTATSMESPVKHTNTGVATPRASPLKPSMTGSPRFALPPTPRCAACEKPVYFAEMVCISCNHRFLGSSFVS